MLVRAVNELGDLPDGGNGLGGVNGAVVHVRQFVGDVQDDIGTGRGRGGETLGVAEEYLGAPGLYEQWREARLGGEERRRRGIAGVGAAQIGLRDAADEVGAEDWILIGPLLERGAGPGEIE
jgi:hypothetical protein